MPTYEYRCGACGHAFERFQKMSDDPIRSCPECGEEEAERLISPGGGLVFKGSGFYATDYRDPPPSRKGGGGGSSDGDAAGPAAKESEKAAGGGTESSGDDADG